MSNKSDPDLLRAFSLEGSETAFTTLVARHTNLVYGTALRKTANPALAEEAAQNTFAILARKAKKLATHPAPLAAWLHRTATYEASKASRSETRHRRKMDALSDQQSTSPPDGDGAAWPDLHPHLDDAIGKLAEPDRQLVLLHHYQGVALKDIATFTGKTPAATHKQHQRALAKLAAHLQRAGAPAASVALLAAGLTSQLTTSAPATLAPALAKSALAAAPTLSLATITTNALVTMSTAKLTTATVAAVVLVAAVPLGIQRNAIATERRTIATLEQSRDTLRAQQNLPQAPSFTASSTGLRSLLAIPDIATLGAASIDLAALLKDINDSNHNRSPLSAARAAATLNAIAKLPRHELDALADRIESVDTTSKKRASLVGRITANLDKTDPEHSLDLLRRFLTGADASSAQDYLLRTIGSIRTFAEKDPSAAIAWFRNADSDNVFEPKNLDDSYNYRRDIIGKLFGALAPSHPKEALTFFQSLPPEDQAGSLRHAATDLKTGPARDMVLELAASLPDSEERLHVYSSLANSVSSQHGIGDQTAAFIAALDIDADQRAELFTSAASDNTRLRSLPVEDVIDWLKSHVPPGETDKAIGTVLGNHAFSRNPEASQIFADLHAAGASDILVTEYIRFSALDYNDPTRALKFIATVGDPDLRRSAADRVIKYWSRKNPETLETAIKHSGLPPAEFQNSAGVPPATMSP